MFATIGWLAFGIVTFVLAADAVHSYVKSDGSMWDKMLAIGKNSVSILSARVMALGGFALQGIVELADLLASPGVKMFIDQYVNAKAVGYTLIACALISEIARRRTLSVPVVGVTPPEPVAFMSVPLSKEK